MVRRARIRELREELGISDQADHHPPLVQVESNVEEWPVFQLGRSKSNSARAEQTITGEDGSELQQRLEVSAPGKYRLPGRFDYDVYSAVLELLELRGGMPEDGMLGFSLHELILIMGLQPSGRTYEEIRRSLRRISATVLESDNAFWSKGQQRHISDTFNLWNVRFDSITDKNGSGSRHEIEFGKLFRRSFEEHYLRGLNIEFFWELDSPVAKRLYRLVDLKRDGAASWRTDLFDLQRRIPIGPYGYVSKIKEKLSAAHEELIERGFLASVSYEGKSGINYAVSEAFRDRRKGLELAGTKEEIIAIKLLTESGLRGDVARDLVAKHGPAHCTRYANALPYQRNLRNPAGWLRRAIEKGFELPEPLPLGPQSAPTETERSLFEGTAAETQPPPLPPPDPAAEKLWEQVLQDAEGAIEDVSSLEVWFEEITPVGLQEDVLTIAVPNAFAKEYIESRFGALIESSLRRKLSNEKASLLVVVGSATQ
jgi:hypothetical protein